MTSPGAGPAAPAAAGALSTRRVLAYAALAMAVMLFFIAAAFQAGRTYPVAGNDAAVSTPTATFDGRVFFTPPAESAIPAGPDGDAIRRGREIFLHTGQTVGAHVGNGLACGNCHLDAGRRDNAAPMWAAWGKYPAYRAKNGRINTMEDRIHDCFLYSMNAAGSPSGAPPPYGDDVYRDLQLYFAWLATGAPTGATLNGRGYIQLPPTALGHDPARGKAVYDSHCAACHGAQGQGQLNTDGSVAYPPLWGAKSYNWGAGMTNVRTAAGFIAANMPYGQGYTLTTQQAWDVAAYIDSRDRPRDPRQTGSIADARARYHSPGDYYGQTVDGDLLGDGK